MRNFTIGGFRLAFAFCFCTLAAIGQQTEKYKLIYDNWPVTVAANADVRSKMGSGVNSKFVPVSSWDHRILTYFFQNGTPDMAGNTERDAVRQGMALWEAQSNIRFLEVCSASNADILILWGAGAHGDNSPFDGTNGELAHSFFPPPDGDPIAGDVHFDEGETWTDAIRGSTAQPIDLVSVAAHEIGHSLGLDHTTVAGSLMLLPYYQSHRFLGSDDIAGIHSLYGIPSNFINGPDIVCATSSFSAVDVPASATVTWASNNTSLLTINSSSGVATKVGNGLVTITATVSTGCGSTTLNRNIWVGLSSPPSVISFESDPCGSYVGAGTENVVSPVKYTWNLDFTDYETTSTNLYLENGVPPVPSFQLNAGQHFLKVKVENACGTSNYGSSKIFNTSNCGYYAYTASPNPANDYLTVAFENSQEEKNFPESIELFLETTYGKVAPVRKMEIRDETSKQQLRASKKVTFDVGGLARGRYILSVTKEKEVETETSKKVETKHIVLN